MHPKEQIVLVYLGIAALIGFFSVEPNLLLMMLGPFVILFILGFYLDFFSPGLGEPNKTKEDYDKRLHSHHIEKQKKALQQSSALKQKKKINKKKRFNEKNIDLIDVDTEHIIDDDGPPSYERSPFENDSIDKLDLFEKAFKNIESMNKRNIITSLEKEIMTDRLMDCRANIKNQPELYFSFVDQHSKKKEDPASTEKLLSSLERKYEKKEITSNQRRIFRRKILG